MTHFRLIDISGGVSLAQVERALADCNPGDPVIAFDHDAYDIGPFVDVETAMEKFPPMRGGTNPAPAQLIALGRTTENSYTTIYTDGYMPFEPMQPDNCAMKYIIAIFRRDDGQYPTSFFDGKSSTQVRIF